MRRVVITGMGAITPIGLNVEEFFAAVKDGKVGIDYITAFDTTEYKAKLAAQVKGFNPELYMDAKTAKRMERFSQFAVAACVEAMNDSGLDMNSEDAYRIGTSIGSGVGSLAALEREHTKLLERGPSRVNPLLVPMMITNIAAGNAAIRLGLHGKSINVSTACASGTNSIGEAYRSIQCNDADVMFAGGTESSITPIGISGFTALTALSLATDPLKASIPFDRERNGFVMGEGAGILVLEELEHARKRGAKIYAEIVGYGCSSDAYHITSPAEDGSGAARAMINAMNEAGISPEEVDYINAHGTSTHHNDLFETRAIKLAFKDAADKVPISSTKSMIGHLLGAAGAVELIVCVKAVEEGYIHPNVGLKECDEEMNLNYIRGKGINTEVNVAMSNSLGFGGHNATLLVRKMK